MVYAETCDVHLFLNARGAYTVEVGSRPDNKLFVCETVEELLNTLTVLSEDGFKVPKKLFDPKTYEHD